MFLMFTEVRELFFFLIIPFMFKISAVAENYFLFLNLRQSFNVINFSQL